jgi:glycosyltransferase 2 family protein
VGRGAWAATRLVGGAALLALLVWRLGAGPFLAGLRGLRPGTLLAAVAFGGVTTVCSAWRWRIVAAALGVGLPLPGATAAYYRSQFLNSALPGGVLGDVHRGLRHGADVGDLGRCVRAVVWERVAGQLVQAVIAIAVLLTFDSPVRRAMPVVVGVSALVTGVLLVIGRGLARSGPAGLARALRSAAAEVRCALLRPGTLPQVLLASLVVVAGHVGMFMLAARAAGVPGTVGTMLPLAMVVLLAAGIPLNIAGWGPREGAAAWIFAAAGPGAGAGAAIATAFGVLTLVAVLPGAGLLAVGLRHVRSPSPPHEPRSEVAQISARKDGVARV